MPEKARYITFEEYLGILGKILTGKVNVIILSKTRILIRIDFIKGF